jgi:hypothetical protein
LLAAGPEAFLSHRTAAAVHRLKLFEHIRLVEVIVPHRRGLEIPGVVIHRPRRVLDADRTVANGSVVASVERTLFDLAGVVPKRAVEPALDDAMLRRLTTFERLCERLERIRAPGVPGIRVMAGLLAERSGDPSVQSVLEDRFFRLLVQAGVPPPEPQWDISGPDGAFIGRVDFAFVDVKLAIEVDGYGFHSDRLTFQSDRVRQNALVAAGWTVLRFTSADLATRPQEVVALVVSFLERSRSTLGRLASG